MRTWGVSDALQTKIGRQSPVINIEESSDSPSEDDQDDTEEEGEEQTDTTSHSTARDEDNGEKDGTEEGAVEDETASFSSSNGVSNNRFSQNFLQRDEGHFCFICQETHHLTSTNLTTLATEAQCAHVYCYIRLSSRKRVSENGNLTCPKCMCIALNIIHHKPIRLDDGLPYFRNTPQKELRSSEGHECGICFENFNLRDTDLGTMDTTKPCRHIFCHDCLLKHKLKRIKDNRHIKCPLCRAVSVDIIHHEKRPGNEVEVIKDAPTGYCDWAMDTTSSTGIGN